MNVGVVLQAPPPLESLRSYGRSLIDAIKSRHTVRTLPATLAYCPSGERVRLENNFVRENDIIIGNVMPDLLLARMRTRSPARFIWHLMGDLARGAHGWKHLIGQLSSDDVLVVHCEPDLRLARRFFKNVRITKLPFPYDDRVFKRVSTSTRSRIREKLGFAREDRVVVYAGRLAIEKNVHGLLRVFRGVTDISSVTRLVIVGRVDPGGFNEMGVEPPVHWLRTLASMSDGLSLPTGRVQLVPGCPPHELAQLLTAADVAVNLTLNHDEAFGLAQVEAMACGTPVVGTCWGGLQDTIVGEVSGLPVGVVVRDCGIRFDWWEAINQTVALLLDDARRRTIGQRAAEYAREKFSTAVFNRQVLQLLSDTARRSPTTPRQASPRRFARDYWLWRSSASEYAAPFAQAKGGAGMYANLLSYHGKPGFASLETGVPMTDDQLAYLAVPVGLDRRDRLRFNEPLSQPSVLIPRHLRSVIPILLDRFNEQPVTSIGELLSGLRRDRARIRKAIVWMIRVGVVLRSTKAPGWVDPKLIGPQLNRSVLRTVYLDRDSTDVIVLE